MNPLPKRYLLLTPLAVIACNLLLAYAVYFLARIIYLTINYSYFYQDLTLVHLFELLGAGLVFDTSAILVTNIPYIVLMLLPWHGKERPAYQQFCRWVFVIVNSVALAINLIDACYFRFTMRRTTTTVFSEFANEQNLGSIFFTETLNHLYLVFLFAFVAWGLYRLARYSTLRHDSLRWWHYDVAMLLSLAFVAPFVVAGIRGGFATAVRPITISNANQYVNRPIEAALVLNTPSPSIAPSARTCSQCPTISPANRSWRHTTAPYTVPPAASWRRRMSSCSSSRVSGANISAPSTPASMTASIRATPPASTR